MAIVAATFQCVGAAIVELQVRAENGYKPKHGMTCGIGKPEVTRLEIRNRAIVCGYVCRREVTKALHSAIFIEKLSHGHVRNVPVCGLNDLDSGTGGCCYRHIFDLTGLNIEYFRGFYKNTAGCEVRRGDLIKADV